MSKSRALLLFVLVCLSGLAYLAPIKVHICLAAVFGLTVAVAVSRETARHAASLWALAGSTAYLIPFALQPHHNTNHLESLSLYGLVPLGILLLALQSHALTRKMARALATSEVARAKLTRSNNELALSIDTQEAALTKLTTIVDNIADGLVVLGRDREVILANHSLAALLELPSPQPADVQDALPPPLVALATACITENAVTTDTFALDNGHILFGSASPVPLKGSLWGAVVLVRDVTLQQEIDRMKSDFTATVSHEMRTPLTSVLGFTKLIQTTYEKHILPNFHSDDKRANRAAEKIIKNLDIVHEEGQRLAALIDDVLDISKMEAGEMEFDMQSHSPETLISKAVDASQPLFNNSTDLQADIQKELPAILADRARIQQVLLNLIGNANKFTDAGSVIVSASKDGDFVRFWVRDTGVGIPPSHQLVIFDKFKQVGDVLTDRPAGTGLGLPICREIVTQHGGQIGVDSTLGEGSTFWFTIPLFIHPDAVQA